jgi:outer membrane protein OmpA-like peptidoglycan-associated protein
MDLLRKALCCLALLVFTQVDAQNYLGIHSSNYTGVMATDLQPASFVDSRFKWDVNLFSINATTWQNVKYFDTKDMPKWYIKSFADSNYNGWSKPDSTFMDRYMINLFDANSTSPLGIYGNFQIDILNFMFHINPRIAIGFSGKSRTVVNVDNLDPKLAMLSEKGLDLPSLWNQQFNDKLLTINALSWLEYGLNYSQIIKDNEDHFFKAGGRLKFLHGVGAAYVTTDDFVYKLDNKDTSLLLQGDFNYGYSGNIDGYMNGTGATSGYPPMASKLGLGIDIGFVYEWRPDWKEYKYDMDNKTNIWRRDAEKYKLRVGASVLDIGGMKFQKGGLSRDFSVNSKNPFNLTVFQSADGLEGFDHILDSLALANPTEWQMNEEVGKTFFMNTPTALSFQIDYNIYKRFYVNATTMTNLLSVKSVKNANKVHVANQYSITPSYDQAWFGVYVPVSYNQYSGFKVGTGLRLGPLTVGMTDYNSFLARGKVRGTEFYLGLRLPVLYMHPDDRDGDKISDKLDECEEIPGLWSFMGCPDTDGDGIKDTEDACPDVAGLAKFKGCPDTDGDGIIDSEDDCPELAGIPAFNGCPDTDNDSIIDPKDDCPDVFGLVAFNGCPDSDGDGIKDSEDACPNAAGPLVNNGCPDTDLDGIFDFLDNCPEVYGPKENNGCPWPDTDNDGLLDKDDKCPYVAGPLKNQGCPYQDTDGDGIIDAEDECPTVKGVLENKGCPKIEEEAAEILQTAFDNLEFNSGNAIIKPGSFESLDKLAELLIKKEEWKLQIAGHTDNVGNDQNNLVLSKKRAEAVKAYLVSKGLEANRFSTLFFGEMQPIESNDTEEGRQKNRRVEMTIVFQ